MDPLLTPAAGAAPAAGAPEDKVRAQAEAAAQKFEAFFITEMLRQMRRTTREMAADDSASNQRINEDMLDMADGRTADTLAGQRAFGIADAILRQLLPPQAPGVTAAVDRAFKPGAKPVASAE
ncbi:rod-binding protein [Aquabacterium sp. A7-Y]|uniref:rod-binding protein n=1 Tax=Aquabacterium sp. A7-Y TaxID=1349605 RepID=UPI00223E36DB|nr:rod-binding protein [Aquabacterium sp. A7-Y]MCW7536543.1 rod-binding protein [Aquabacterium sp. A7-Y]